MANRKGSGRMLLECGAGLALCVLSAVLMTHGIGGFAGAPAQAVPGPPYDLSVLKTDLPDPVAAGNTITYTIDVTVTETMAATAPANDAIVLTDNVPANTTFVSLAAPAGYNCVTPPVGGTGMISCTSASPIVAGQVQFTLIVNVPPSVSNGTVVSNTADVKPELCVTPPCDDIPGNDSSTATTDVVTQAHLVFTKTASPDVVLPYTIITYTLTVTNTGPSDAQNVKIMDTIPAASGFVGAVPSAGGVCTTPAVGDSGVVDCTFAGATPPGGTHSVQIQVRACENSSVCDQIENQGSASSSTTDPNPDEDTDTVVTDVLPLPVPVTSAVGLVVGILLLFGVAFLTLYSRRSARR